MDVAQWQNFEQGSVCMTIRAMYDILRVSMRLHMCLNNSFSTIFVNYEMQLILNGRRTRFETQRGACALAFPLTSLIHAEWAETRAKRARSDCCLRRVW